MKARDEVVTIPARYSNKRRGQKQNATLMNERVLYYEMMKTMERWNQILLNKYYQIRSGKTQSRCMRIPVRQRKFMFIIFLNSWVHLM